MIGTDKSGTADRGNSNQGILIEGATGNTVGGTTSAARNVISANQWGVRIDGATASGNLIEGNYVGTDITGNNPLGNEINGVILSNNASNNTIGGTGGGQGNVIAYNVQAGVLVAVGNGRLDPVEQHRLQRTAGDRTRNRQRSASRANRHRSQPVGEPEATSTARSPAWQTRAF